MNPYYIQSASFKNYSDSDCKGIDKHLHFHYMGSSEFEDGSLFHSLKRIRANVSNYEQCEHNFENYPHKTVIIFCEKGQSKIIKDILEQLSMDLIRLKDRCRLVEYLKGEKQSRTYDFWWDIDNDFMFWVDKIAFTEKFNEEMNFK